MSEKDRVSRARDIALKSLDAILECYPEQNFVEIVGRAGGDTVTCRIYDDGRMYER